MREKSVFISHSSKDNDLALQLGTAIEEKIGQGTVWVDFHDLSMGEELAPIISHAIGKAKWFILIASNDAMSSHWVQNEAKWAIFEAIEKNDFEILTLKIDNCKFPPSIDLPLRSRRYLQSEKNHRAAIQEIVDLIDSETSTRTNEKNAFINRGNELDNLELNFEKSKVFYLVGWHGIGKTSLINEFANVRLGRPYIKIAVTSGHDLELLCRQIIGLTGEQQPTKTANSNVVLEKTLSALSDYQTKNQGFLFIDDAENAMQEYGDFRPFFSQFIKAYREAAYINLPVMVSVIQKPDLNINEVDDSGIQIVGPLSDAFIKTLVSRLYFAIRNEDLPKDIDLEHVNDSIGGHPLAAKFLASYLAFESPQILKRQRFVSSFRKNVAEYILQSFKNRLPDLDLEILQNVAICENGLTINDLAVLLKHETRSKEGADDEILEALSRLANRMLINLEGELINLHPFIRAFFLQQITDSGEILQVAGKVGNYCFSQTSKIQEKLKNIDISVNAREYRSLNIELLRYAVPAHRLLLLIGQDKRVEELPFLLRGHLRVMVFDYYQIHKDYETTIDFANKWLVFEKNDAEILLFKARALRRLGRPEEATRILERIYNFPGDRIKAMVAREYGFMAKDEQDYDTAIYHFGAAVSIKNSQGNPVYPLALGDKASALVQRANQKGEKDPSKIKDLKEAVDLFEEAQNYVSNFDQYMLPTYIDALFNLGEEAKAIELLNEAIIQYPSHGSLNLRMADFLRKTAQGDEEALQYAERAFNGGQSAGLTLMATIYIDQGKANKALEVLESYMPKNPSEHSVVNSIKIRAYLSIDDLDMAEVLLNEMEDEGDPLAMINRLELAIRKAEHFLYSNEKAKCQAALNQAKDTMEKAKSDFPYHSQFTIRQSRIDMVSSLLFKSS